MVTATRIIYPQNGGPPTSYVSEYCDGGTLRDVFAAQAMAGMATKLYTLDEVERAAGTAYQIADAMLRARQQAKQS
jgi:hypothetical protein